MKGYTTRERIGKLAVPRKRRRQRRGRRGRAEDAQRKTMGNGRKILKNDQFVTDNWTAWWNSGDDIVIRQSSSTHTYVCIHIRSYINAQSVCMCVCVRSVCACAQKCYTPWRFDAIGFPIPSNWNPGNSQYSSIFFSSYPVANKNRLLPHKIAPNLFRSFDSEIEWRAEKGRINRV